MSTDNTGLTFANATEKQKSDYGYDVTVNGLASFAKGLYKLIDDAADAPWMVADFTTNTLADVTGNQDLRTNFSWTEWFMDKWGKWVKKIKDKISEVTHSDLRDTNEWQLFYDMAEATWEVVPTLLWGWVWAKATTKMVNPKAMVESLKKIPGAVDELKILLWKWWKVTQWKVAELYAKYVTKLDDLVDPKRVINPGKNMDEITWAYNAKPPLLKSGKSMDQIVGDYNRKISSSPKVKEYFMKKHPLIATAILGWSLLGWSLGAINGISQSQMEEFEKDLENIDASATDVTPTDGTITLPEVDPKDPETIAAKKKELQTMKEKNAGTLNAATSVVDLMKMLWVDSTMEARKVLFEGLTSKSYEGTAEQNIQLKALVEEMFSNGTLSDKIKSFKR